MLDVTKFQLWKCPHINTQTLLIFIWLRLMVGSVEEEPGRLQSIGSLRVGHK